LERTPAGATESESNRTATDSRPDRIRHNTSTSTRAAHRTSHMSPAKADGHAGQTLGLRYGAARDDVDTGQSNRKQKRLNSNRQPTRGQDCGRTSYTVHIDALSALLSQRGQASGRAGRAATGIVRRHAQSAYRGCGGGTAGRSTRWGGAWQAWQGSGSMLATMLLA